MVIVYVWDPSTTSHGWGHAAIRVQDEYLSVGSTSPREPTFPWAGFTKDKIYSSKMAVYSHYDPGWPATHEIHIPCLDEMQMLEWIHRFKASVHIYHTLEENCSWVTYKVLEAGGGDRHVGLWNERNVFWTPMDILRYAQELAHNPACSVRPD